jgi:hypothetical protein
MGYSLNMGGNKVMGINDYVRKYTSKSYFEASKRQFIYGNYGDDVTALGTAGQIGAAFAGIDLPMDLRDISADLVNWEWTGSHYFWTALDIVSVLPVVGGVVRVADDGAYWAKMSYKVGEEIDGVKVVETYDNVVILEDNRKLYNI